MQKLPTVQTRSTTDKAVAHVKTFGGKFSHDTDLPLRVRIKRTSWFGRRISVTTTENVWYRDAVTFIECAADFTYDLASIPRLVWFIVSPWDIALESLFHDLNYRAQKTKRSYADFMLRSMMEDRGVPWAIRWAVYLAVRMFGWKAWSHWANVNAAASTVSVVATEESDTPSALAPDKVE